MADWWNELGTLKQIFYTIAMPATIILVVQSIMSVIGLSDFDTDVDGLDGMDADGFDGVDALDELDAIDELDGLGESVDQGLTGDFRFFTIRGIIAFFTVFGWTGAALAGKTGYLATVFVALLSGLAAMGIIGYLFYAMTKLKSSGNIHYKNCIGKTGEVYLTIPPSKQGKGKVTLTVQERLIEVNAITEDDKPIKSGDGVKVVGMLSDHTAIVERI